MKIKISILATAISLTVFACSESPSSPSDDSSSSEVISSSSQETIGNSSSSSSVVSSSSSIPVGTTEGRACEYIGEDFGFDGLTLCEEMPADTPNMYEHKIDCELEGGTWINACPSGEKATCIDDEDEETKDISYKLYTESFYTCSDLFMKNADGSEDVISMGGACGPYKLVETVPLLVCSEFRGFPTTIVKFSCAEQKVPFSDECPGYADLTCYNPEEDMISYFYGEGTRELYCEDFDMEEI